MKTLFLVLFLSLVMPSCRKLNLCEDDQLAISKSEYNGTQLRIDGFYYKDVSNNSESSYTTITLLYQDGIYTGSDGYTTDDVTSGYMNIEKMNSAVSSKAAWGVFQIIANSIEIENWRKVSVGCLRTLYEKGVITSDTSYVITHREYRNDGNVERVEKINDIYYFRPLLMKPDSINEYIH